MGDGVKGVGVATAVAVGATVGIGVAVAESPPQPVTMTAIAASMAMIRIDGLLKNGIPTLQLYGPLVSGLAINDRECPPKRA